MSLPLVPAARAAAGKHDKRPAQQFLPQPCWAGSALVPKPPPQAQSSSASWHGEPRQAPCRLWHSPGLRNNPTTLGSFDIIYLSWSFLFFFSLCIGINYNLDLKKNMNKNSAAFATGYSIKYRFISCLHPAGYAGLIRNTGGGQTRTEGG